MKIGFDLQASNGQKTGLGVYTENLARALTNGVKHDHSFNFYDTHNAEDWNTPKRWWWANMDLPKRIKRDNVDLLHVPAFAPPWKVPCKLVVTVHDLIGMIYRNQRGLPSRLYWGNWLPMTVKRADALIADSESTKNDLIKYLKVKESKISVIYPSGHEKFSVMSEDDDFRQLKERLGIKERYQLFVGTIEPRKNLSRVIEAFTQFLKSKRRENAYQLVVVGKKEFAHGKVFQELLKNNQLNLDNIIFTGYLDHDDLNRLYCGAEVFLFPSLYEGFGIPVIEAMAAGVPVLTSNVSSLPEVAGDAALTVNPYDVEQIANGMKRLAEEPNLRIALVSKGFQQIRKFSWHRAAKQTLEVYESLF